MEADVRVGSGTRSESSTGAAARWLDEHDVSAEVCQESAQALRLRAGEVDHLQMAERRLRTVSGTQPGDSSGISISTQEWAEGSNVGREVSTSRKAVGFSLCLSKTHDNMRPVSRTNVPATLPRRP